MMYALLIHEGHAEDDPIAPEVEERLMEGHMALQSEAVAAGELHSTARLHGPSRARTVRKDGEEFRISDGPYMETKEWLVGLYVVECESEEVALARARQICPPDGSIEVREVRWQRVPAEEA